MPTITWDGCFPSCARRVLELLTTTDSNRDSFLVVFDGHPPPPPDWLVSSRARLLATGMRSGPAVARNLAADRADGDILVFVDADVELHRDVFQRIRRHFEGDPLLDALFGSYDDRPAAPGLVSQFRNLLHHHTHTSHAGSASTFWAGCGAIRRSRFEAIGGFDGRYTRPSIEDIELGMRLAAGGGKLLLDPGILCTHHKQWSLGSMVITDIRQRAVPWTRLLRRQCQSSWMLNLSVASRLSGLIAVALVASLPLVPLFPSLAWVSGTCLIGVLILNRNFYGTCLSHGGPVFLLGSIALHLLFLFDATFTFGLVVVHLWLTDPCQPTTF